MKKERILILNENHDCDSTLKKMQNWLKIHGFDKDNALLVTVHSLPHTAPTVEELAEQFTQFIGPGKFEFIFKGEYKELACYSKWFKEDITSTTHIHSIFKGSYSELKPYLDEWNKNTPYIGGQLFHVTPLNGSLKSTLFYLFKELTALNGFKAAGFGMYYRKEDGVQIVNPVTIFLDELIRLKDLYLHNLILIQQRALYYYSNYISIVMLWLTKFTYVIETYLCFDKLPNAPPKCCNFSELFRSS